MRLNNFEVGYYSQAIREKMAISIAQSFAVEMAMEFHPFRLDVWDVSFRGSFGELVGAKFYNVGDDYDPYQNEFDDTSWESKYRATHYKVSGDFGIADEDSLKNMGYVQICSQNWVCRIVDEEIDEIDESDMVSSEVTL